MILSFEPTDPRLFFTRGDPQDPRFGDRVQAIPRLSSATDLSAVLAPPHRGNTKNGHDENHDLRQFILAGYPDDEGIRINGGRLGASQAPNAIRKPLYKMTPNVLAHGLPDFQLWDLGDLPTLECALEHRHATATEYARATLDTGARWIGMGGGHDYGFPDAAAFIQWCQQGQAGQVDPVRPLVINFDAHLDVRPTDRGLSSGTPFFRMLEAFPEVDFAEIGIQSHCNSRHHFEWARSKGAVILTQEEVEASGEPFATLVLRCLGDWCLKPRPVFLSVDIDGFSSSVAPGCSQSWATGFTPSDFFPLLQILIRRLDVRMLGIYEVSPPLDHDDRTAKLAAQIIHRVVNPC